MLSPTGDNIDELDPPEQVTAICHFILLMADIMAANSRFFDSGDSAIAPNASTASFASALEGTD
jgi:hypothetical protein